MESIRHAALVALTVAHAFAIGSAVAAQEQGKSRGLVQGDAETLAGLIMRLLDAVPVEGETVYADGLQLRIERMRGRAIESVIASLNLAGRAGDLA